MCGEERLIVGDSFGVYRFEKLAEVEGGGHGTKYRERILVVCGWWFSVVSREMLVKSINREFCIGRALHMVRHEEKNREGLVEAWWAGSKHRR